MSKTTAQASAPRSGDPIGHEPDLVRVLSAGIAGRAIRVLVGLNWTWVESAGGVGLCQTPERNGAGCRSIAAAGTLGGAPLADLAALAASDEPFERALGFAAINAHHNREDLAGEALNGLDLLEDRGSRTVIVGRFPRLARALPGAAVIERNPGPGNHAERSAPALLADAEQVAITSSALANGSLRGLLRHVRPGAFLVLVGPSTPLAPVLFAHGIGALSGTVVSDRAGAYRAVAEGGAVEALKPFMRMVTLRS